MYVLDPAEWLLLTQQFGHCWVGASATRRTRHAQDLKLVKQSRLDDLLHVVDLLLIKKARQRRYRQHVAQRVTVGRTGSSFA